MSEYSCVYIADYRVSQHNRHSSHHVCSMTTGVKMCFLSLPPASDGTKDRKTNCFRTGSTAVTSFPWWLQQVIIKDLPNLSIVYLVNLASFIQTFSLKTLSSVTSQECALALFFFESPFSPTSTTGWVLKQERGSWGSVCSGSALCSV